MTAKAHVLELIQKLPDEVSYERIAREIDLAAGVRQAQDQIARGEGISVEEVLKQIPTWIRKS